LWIATHRLSVDRLRALLILTHQAQVQIRQGVFGADRSPREELHTALGFEAKLLVLAIVLKEESKLQRVLATAVDGVVLQVEDRVGVIPWNVARITGEEEGCPAPNNDAGKEWVRFVGWEQVGGSPSGRLIQ